MEECAFEYILSFLFILARFVLCVQQANDRVAKYRLDRYVCELETTMQQEATALTVIVQMCIMRNTYVLSYARVV